jgi:YHS domain-containing protein
MKEQAFIMFDRDRRFVLAGGLSILTVVLPGTGVAQSALEKRLALWGRDPVSYFTEGQPKRGSKDFTAPFDDSIYRFKSAEHRTMFTADPERYAPQFNAYCTGSMSRGRKIEANPDLWAIHDGKLYVFESAEALAAFRTDAKSMIEKANANWPALIKARLSPPRR